MLSMVILATAMYVCPGNVFSDVQGPGCKPFVEERGTVSIDQDTPQSSGPAPSSSSDSPSRPETRRAQPQSSMNAEMCAMYKEYIEMGVRTQGGFQTSGPSELQRWQTLKRMFQGSTPPDCP